MRLTEAQMRVVEDNMGLVGKVLKDKIYSLADTGCYTREDLYQIGCIGLCKAAATDKGGCFSTYAYRLIWNEICDALVCSSRIEQREISSEPELLGILYRCDDGNLNTRLDLDDILEQAMSRTTKTAAKGIQCLRLSAQGYTSEDLSRHFDASPGTIRMWMTRGRQHLRTLPELQSYLSET